MYKFLSACFVVSLCLVHSAPAQAQKLIKAEFYSKTGDDNKDKDTGVYVTVYTNDGKRF